MSGNNNNIIPPNLKFLILGRNIVGFFYGALMWSSVTKDKLGSAPLLSSISISLWGCLGVFAVAACSEVGPRPVSDCIVTAALLFAGAQRLIGD